MPHTLRGLPASDKCKQSGPAAVDYVECKDMPLAWAPAGEKPQKNLFLLHLLPSSFVYRVNGAKKRIISPLWSTPFCGAGSPGIAL